MNGGLNVLQVSVLLQETSALHVALLVDLLVNLGVPAILMAMGVRLVYANQKYVGIAVAIFLIVSMFATIQPLIKDRADYSGPRGFAEYVKANTEPNAVIVSSDEYLFIRRYGERKTFYWLGEGIDDVGVNLRNATPVYAIESSFAFTSQDDQRRIQNLYNLQVIGEAPNEVYQFSELEHKLFNEKLIKITLKEEVAPASSSIPTAEEPVPEEKTEKLVAEDS